MHLFWLMPVGGNLGWPTWLGTVSRPFQFRLSEDETPRLDQGQSASDHATAKKLCPRHTHHASVTSYWARYLPVCSQEI